MRNLHKYYYKDYFSSDEVLVGNKKRRLDFELLVDDTKKKDLESKIKEKDKKLKEAKENNNTPLKTRLEGEKKELEEQLAVNVNILKVRNKTLTGTDFVKKNNQNKPTRELENEARIINEVSPNDNDNRFSLTIQYPGLVTGIGIDHEAKIEGEFKLGVHFDWTRGMPVVYGSSVKGVLRVWFREFYKPNPQKPSVDDTYYDVFEGKGKSIYDRDIFFDAVVTKADSKGRILAPDSITPHGDNPLKNPTPLPFLKIASGCTLEFRFKLVDTEIDGKVFSAKDKLELFKEILTTVGVGAKTRVGYGQLSAH